MSPEQRTRGLHLHRRKDDTTNSAGPSIPLTRPKLSGWQTRQHVLVKMQPERGFRPDPAWKKDHQGQTRYTTHIMYCPLRGVPFGRLSQNEQTPLAVMRSYWTRPEELLLFNLPSNEPVWAARLSAMCRVDTLGILA
jgi:hypothetical protein